MLFNLDDKRVYGLVLADFQKAFDLVSHNILIEKLRIYGLDNSAWVLSAPSFTTAGSAQSSAEVHNPRPRLSCMEYHRGPYSLHCFSWYL